MINVQVEKNDAENNLNVIRRFSKRVRESGILNRLRRERYHKRPPSPLMRKKSTLKRIAKQAEIAELIKLGKINPEDAQKKKKRGRR